MSIIKYLLNRLNLIPPKGNQKSAQAGFLLPTVLSLMLIGVIVGSVTLEVIVTNYLQVGNNVQRQQAFNIAEAGLNYYLWHLSHNSSDFKDGKSTPAVPDPVLGFGPYVHDYIDDAAINQGTFTLYIKPQGNGSTIATVRSIGKIKNGNIQRTAEAQIGATSFASYAIASDSALWFGDTESSNGPVHSNQGVRMDGGSSGDVTSANTTYQPPDSLGGDGNNHPGVWCHPSVTTPVNCNTRSKADWRYPVPLVDFNQVSGSLCTIKKVAFSSDAATAALAGQSNACNQTPNTRTSAYLPQRSTSGSFSISKGYLIQLNPNGTYNLSQVNAETDTSTPYTSALSLTSVATNISLPSSGVIFAEDNVWVRSNPTFSGRVTIAAGRLATTKNANIVIADDIVYGSKNGSDAIGLVAEGDVILAPYAPPASGAFNFEVDAAVLAQSGAVTYPLFYRVDSDRCTRGWINSNQTFLYYGSIANRLTWTWTWLLGNNSCGDAVKNGSRYITGVINNSTQYDNNLLYAPPPSYPITGGYSILNWREVLVAP